MNHLIHSFISILLGTIIGTSALWSSEARPTIYLFGETHRTSQAIMQQDCLKSYARANKIMLAQEAGGFDEHAFLSGDFWRGEPNETGSEDILLYAANSLAAVLVGYQFEACDDFFRHRSSINKLAGDITSTVLLFGGGLMLKQYYLDYFLGYLASMLNDPSLPFDQWAAIYTYLPNLEAYYNNQFDTFIYPLIVSFIHGVPIDFAIDLLRGITIVAGLMLDSHLTKLIFLHHPLIDRAGSAFMALFYPECDDFFNHVGNAILKEHLLFKKLVQVRMLLRETEFESQIDRENAYQLAAINLQADFPDFSTFQERMDFYKLLLENVLTYLASTTQLKEELPFINDCLTAVKDVLPDEQTQCSMRLFDVCDLPMARNYPIASNLAYMQPIVAERGLILAGIYGHYHIMGIKAILEDQGFEVVINDMAALEAAIAASEPRSTVRQSTGG